VKFQFLRTGMILMRCLQDTLLLLTIIFGNHCCQDKNEGAWCKYKGNEEMTRAKCSRQRCWTVQVGTESVRTFWYWPHDWSRYITSSWARRRESPYISKSHELLQRINIWVIVWPCLIMLHSLLKLIQLATKNLWCWSLKKFCIELPAITIQYLKWRNNKPLL